MPARPPCLSRLGVGSIDRTNSESAREERERLDRSTVSTYKRPMVQGQRRKRERVSSSRGGQEGSQKVDRPRRLLPALSHRRWEAKKLSFYLETSQLFPELKGSIWIFCVTLSPRLIPNEPWHATARRSTKDFCGSTNSLASSHRTMSSQNVCFPNVRVSEIVGQ